MDVNEILKKRAYELKQFRIEKKLSIDELSKLSGLSRATIYRIENGTIGWSVYCEIVYFKTLEEYIVISKAG